MTPIRQLAAVRGLPEATAAYTVSGAHDAIVMLTAETSAHLDEVLTRIGKLPGVNRTTSAILLSTLFERNGPLPDQVGRTDDLGGGADRPPSDHQRRRASGDGDCPGACFQTHKHPSPCVEC